MDTRCSRRDAVVRPDDTHDRDIDRREDVLLHAPDAHGAEQDDENRPHHEGVWKPKRDANEPHHDATSDSAVMAESTFPHVPHRETQVHAAGYGCPSVSTYSYKGSLVMIDSHH